MNLRVYLVSYIVLVTHPITLFIIVMWAILTILSILFIIIGILLLRFAPTSITYIDNAIVAVNIASSHPILIGSDNFKSSSFINITLTNLSIEQKVYIYHKSLCNDTELPTNFTNLYTKTIPPVTVKDFRAGLNYHGNDTPIYLAIGSHLRYDFNITSNDGSCLQLFVIDSSDAYIMFISSTTNTAFKKYIHIHYTNCFGTKVGNFTIDIDVVKLQGNYYVAYQATGEGNITFSATISGIQVYYDTKGLQTSPCSPLTVNNPNCVIPNNQTCVLVNSINGTGGHLSAHSSDSSTDTSYYLSISVVGIVAVVGLVVVLACKLPIILLCIQYHTLCR